MSESISQKALRVAAEARGSAHPYGQQQPAPPPRAKPAPAKANFKVPRGPDVVDPQTRERVRASLADAKAKLAGSDQQRVPSVPTSHEVKAMLGITDEQWNAIPNLGDPPVWKR